MRRLTLLLLMLALGALPALADPTLTWSPIPSQMSGELFQVSVAVRDSAGHPVAGARVTVRLDASSRVHLRDASRARVQELSESTGPDGQARLWVRLGSNVIPCKARLTATVEGSAPAASNQFTVYDSSTWDEDEQGFHPRDQAPDSPA